jgi:hypothetical protein
MVSFVIRIIFHSTSSGPLSTPAVTLYGDNNYEYFVGRAPQIKHDIPSDIIRYVYKFTSVSKTAGKSPMMPVTKVRMERSVFHVKS